jgi:hypothetical protein
LIANEQAVLADHHRYHIFGVGVGGPQACGLAMVEDYSNPIILQRFMDRWVRVSRSKTAHYPNVHVETKAEDHRWVCLNQPERKRKYERSF